VTTPEGEATLTAMDRSAEPPLPAVSVVAGNKIGRYLVERRIGAGGMGVVYAARDTELGREVALKLVRPRAGFEAMEARLRREAKAMARLSHRNVVPVFDIGTHDRQLFIAMELVTGDTLRSWVAQPRPWRAVIQLFVKAGRGLESAHAGGLLHRDFKPDNVLIGAGDEPRITDFGLARDVGEADSVPSSPPITPVEGSALPQVTATGSLAGTPAYMAPEQLLGRLSGPKADQFSFCVALYEVLYGARPFRPSGPRPEGLIAEIRAGRIARPAATRGVPRWIHAALVRGLAYSPEQRWPSMAALVDALEGRRRARRIRIAAAAAGIAVVAGGAVGFSAMVHGRAEPARCLDLALKGNDATAILVCQEEYARTNDPWVGRELADALRRTGQLEPASTVATALLATPAQAGALYTLGKIAAREGRRDDAERSFKLASKLHREQNKWADSAGDLQGLALVSNDIVDQLVIYNAAIGDARRGDNPRIEAFSRVTAAGLLSELGARQAALGELDRARPALTQPRDAALYELSRGDALQNLGDNALAVAAFERARTGAESLSNARQALSARLNLVYSLAESGQLAVAANQLEEAGRLDPKDRMLAIRLSLEAQIAMRGGDLARAAELIERSVAATAPDETDQLFERNMERADIALRRGDAELAERAARRSIAAVEAMRSSHAPVELRSWMITDRRIPYEQLFASLARRGDAAGALVVLDQIRGLGVLAGLAHGDGATASAAASPAVSHDAGLGFPVEDLARLFPQLQRSALATPVGEPAIRDAVRTGSLLALVVARDELWRIAADAGQLRAESLGPVALVLPQIDRLRASPGDREIAAALGERLVPAALARTTDQVLHVVLDEPLAGLPIAALRIGDRRLIAARPIARVARPSDLGCAAAPPDGHGDGRIIEIDAASADATRGALLAAGRSDLLQIAAPVERDALGDALVLRDGRLRALEIAGHASAPGQVVIAAQRAPGAPISIDLAMAYLAAGSDQVIAALRPTPAAVHHRLAELLRADHGDLVRALARLQTTEDPAGDDWLGFAAFGRERCKLQR
jgi:tetratricopeptide (TPR) repeat protein/predicted Ser/Thr protein kinase